MKIEHEPKFQKMGVFRITPIRLLKLYILLSLSSELPGISNTRGLHPGSWQSSFVSAWSLPPEAKIATANDTETRDGTHTSASNSSIGGAAEASSVSIVRSGIQSSESTNAASAALSSTDVINLKQTAPEPRQDVINQPTEVQTTTSSTSQTVAANHRHHGGHSNHQNYPNEPYPSASYTALSMHHSPSTTFAGNFNLSPNSLAGSHSLLSDREHHNVLDIQADKLQQTSLSDQLLNGYTNQQLQNSYLSSFGATNEARTSAHMSGASIRNDLSGSYDENALNQALVSLASAAAMPSVTFTDNNQIYSNSPAPLNASLIQNLTAGLFPVGKLSNVTMLSLGELLSKTKQATNQQGSSFNNRPNDFDPFDYVTGVGAKDKQLATPSGNYNLAPSSHQANYLEALLGDSRFNSMLDHLTSKPGQTNTAPSHFGYRDPNAVARYQTLSSGSLHRDTLQNANQFSQGTSSHAPTRDNKFDSAQIIVGTRAQQLSKPSNVYNTYLPFKENAKGHNKPMTNGQMLNMAATLYDNYLDQNYRYPLMAKQQQQQQNVKDSAGDYLSSNNNQYQFIQHHNSQNQDHIDKIVYHSTPFRPSIVSPPHQQFNVTNSTQQGNHQSHQRPKTEADSKSMSYAMLGSNNQHLGANSKAHPGFGTNSSRSQQGKFEPIRHHENDPDAVYDHLNGPHSTHKHQMNQTAASNNKQTQLSHNSSVVNKSNSNTKMPPGSSSLQQAPSSAGPQLLLDLYERAIDNQILEAIYSDHHEHFQHLGPSASAGSAPTLPTNNPQTSASVHSQSNWPFDENLVSPFPTSEPSYTINSGTRTPSASGPIALGHQSAGDKYAPGAASSTGVHGSNTVIASTSMAQSSLIEPLTNALQELPTFSASDLQPLMPTSEANSMLTSPTQVAHSTPPLNFNPFISLAGGQPNTINDHTPDASSLASLAAQLFNPLASSGSATSSTPNYNQLLADNEMAISSYMYDNRLPTPIQPHAHQLIQPANSNESNQNSNAINNLGLPTLLAKLQTSQLSSILASPFAHLYANLPRYRYAKSKQPAATTRPRSQVAAHQGARNSRINKQQEAAAAMAAASAANLIAASGHTLTPLQAAMIQAQAATNAYLNTDPSLAEQTNGHSTSVEANAGLQQPTLSQQASSLAFSSLASGLAGGGISPQVWRNILAPVHWARKQTTSGQPNGTANSSSLSGLPSTVQQNSYGSQWATNQALKSTTLNQPNRYSLPVALVNTLWNNNQPPINHLFSASQTQLSSTPLVAPSSSASEPQKRPPSRLKIKILKIPVAFYDLSSTTGSPTGESSVLQNEASTPSISLVPVHLQPSPTASLLASLSCPLHPNHQQMNPFFNANSQTPLSASTPFHSIPLPSGSTQHSYTGLNPIQSPNRLSQFPYQYQSMDQIDSPLGGLKQGATSSERASSVHSAASQSTTNTRTTGDKLTPIRDFTDINQPNDLQVSPSSPSNTLSTQFLIKSS